jgi:hypothetical protein
MYAALSVAIMATNPEGRGPGHPRLARSEPDALAALAALGAPPRAILQCDAARWMPPQRGPQKALWLRSRKADIMLCDAAAAATAATATSKVDALCLASLGGVHVPAGASSSAAKTGKHSKHHRSWSACQILRAAFTPVSSFAYPPLVVLVVLVVVVVCLGF